MLANLYKRVIAGTSSECQFEKGVRLIEGWKTRTDEGQRPTLGVQGLQLGEILENCLRTYLPTQHPPPPPTPTSQLKVNTTCS